MLHQAKRRLSLITTIGLLALGGIAAAVRASEARCMSSEEATYTPSWSWDDLLLLDSFEWIPCNSDFPGVEFGRMGWGERDCCCSEDLCGEEACEGQWIDPYIVDAALDIVAVYAKEESGTIHLRADFLDLGPPNDANRIVFKLTEPPGDSVLELLEVSSSGGSPVFPPSVSAGVYCEDLDYVAFSLSSASLSLDRLTIEVETFECVEGKCKLADETQDAPGRCWKNERDAACAGLKGRGNLVVTLGNAGDEEDPWSGQCNGSFTPCTDDDPCGFKYTLEAAQIFQIPLTTTDPAQNLPSWEVPGLNEQTRHLVKQGLLETIESVVGGHFMPWQPAAVDEKSIRMARRLRRTFLYSDDNGASPSRVFLPYEGHMRREDLELIRDLEENGEKIYTAAWGGVPIDTSACEEGDSKACHEAILASRKIHQLDGLKIVMGMYQQGIFTGPRSWSMGNFPCTRFQGEADGGLSINLRRVLLDMAADRDNVQFYHLNTDLRVHPFWLKKNIVRKHFRWIAEHPWIRAAPLGEIVELSETPPRLDGPESATAPLDVNFRLTDGHSCGASAYHLYFWYEYDGWTPGQDLAYPPFSICQEIRDTGGIDSYADHVPFPESARKMDDLLPSGERNPDSIVQTTLSNLQADELYDGTLMDPRNRLVDLAWLSFFKSINHQTAHLTIDLDEADQRLSEVGKYLHPQAKLRAIHLAQVNKITTAAKWADCIARGETDHASCQPWPLADSGCGTVDPASPGAVAVACDLDLDIEDEYILYNDRVFAIFENDGGLLEYAFAFDKDAGTATQLIAPKYQHHEDGGGEISERAWKSSFRDGAFIDAYGYEVEREGAEYMTYKAESGKGQWTFTRQDDGNALLEKTIRLEGNTLTARYSDKGSPGGHQGLQDVIFSTVVDMSHMFWGHTSEKNWWEMEEAPLCEARPCESRFRRLEVEGGGCVALSAGDGWTLRYGGNFRDPNTPRPYRQTFAQPDSADKMGELRLSLHAAGCPRQIVLLLDTSGSMRWKPLAGTHRTGNVKESRIYLAREAFAAFLDELLNQVSSQKAGIDFGLTRFPEPYGGTCSAGAFQPFRRADETSIGAAKDSFERLDIAGSTPLLEGVQAGIDMLQESPAGERAIVLLSDGWDNCPEGEPPRFGEVVDLRIDLEKMGIDLYAIGFGAENANWAQGLGELSGNSFQAVAFDESGQGLDGLKTAIFGVVKNLFGLQGSPVSPVSPVPVLPAPVSRQERAAPRISPPRDAVHSIKPGATARFELQLTEHDRSLSVLLGWRTPAERTLRLSLEDSQHDPVALDGPAVRRAHGETYTLLTLGADSLHRASVGSEPWIVTITAPPGLQAEEPFELDVLIDSAIELDAYLIESSYAAGETITVTARLREAGEPLLGLGEDSGEAIEMTVSAPRHSRGAWLSTPVEAGRHQILEQIPAVLDDEPFSLAERKALYLTRILELFFPGHEPSAARTLFDDGRGGGDEVAGDGIYTGRFHDTAKEGLYTFEITARGSTRGGNTFVRTAKIQTYLAATIAPEKTWIDVVRTSRDGRRVEDIEITPRDASGGLLGPGHRVALEITTGNETRSLVLEDQLDGTYAVSFATKAVGAEMKLRVGGALWPVDLAKSARAPLSLGLHLGLLVPTGSLDNRFDPGFDLGLDLEVPFRRRRWSLVGSLQNHHLRGGAPTATDEDWWSLSAKARRRFPGARWRPYVNGGLGVYFPESGSAEPGISLGFGFAYETSPRWSFELGLDIHHVFVEDVEATFVVAPRVGLILRSYAGRRSPI